MSTKKYNLTPRQQLIDINEDSVNFEAFISVVSLNQSPFDALVVTQKDLDSVPSFDFKHIEKGIFEAEITQNKNVFENFYLILRANIPTDVNVSISKNVLPELPEIPESIDSSSSLPNSSLPNGSLTNSSLPNGSLPNSSLQQKSSKKKSWKTFAIIAILVIGGLILWYFYNKNKKNNSIKKDYIFTNKVEMKEDYFEPRIEEPIFNLREMTPVETVSIEPSNQIPSVDPELLNKLNNIF